MWYINVSVTYYDYASMISEMVVMKDCNDDAILNKEQCNAVHIIICLTAVSSTELYHMLIVYMFVDVVYE